ncbi:phage tail protein [Flavobacterium poyangense]|uniref:phage tail protein n=1 Tax=Flavobacterium poyangense TaxID=2204302 RepID=UPI0014225322|nr:tail fiber protein [Flavobacterium sp. JXAS1]
MSIVFTQVPMGTILASVLNDTYIPEGWLRCDGKSIPSKYKALINAIGNVTPNLCGRTLIGYGDAVNNYGSINPNFEPNQHFSIHDKGGEYKHQLTTNEMPTHAHLINSGNFAIHHRSFEGEKGDDRPFKTNPGSDDVPIRTTNESGGNGFHNTMQPYYVINYIIYAGMEE